MQLPISALVASRIWLNSPEGVIYSVLQADKRPQPLLHIDDSIFTKEASTKRTPKHCILKTSFTKGIMAREM
jgi:hypothetical protein